MKQAAVPQPVHELLMQISQDYESDLGQLKAEKKNLEAEVETRRARIEELIFAIAAKKDLLGLVDQVVTGEVERQENEDDHGGFDPMTLAKAHKELASEIAAQTKEMLMGKASS